MGKRKSEGSAGTQETNETETKREKEEDGVQIFSSLICPDVAIKEQRCSTVGVHRDCRFTSKRNSPLSMKEIKRQINTQTDLKIRRGVSIFLYPAFKTALLRLLMRIEQIMAGDEESQIILIHGVRHIGKSTLARCLAYFLSLLFGPGPTQYVHLMELVHSGAIDRDALTRDVISPLTSDNVNFVVVDQANILMLDPVQIGRVTRERFCEGDRIPLVVFTSGHYAPTDEWLRRREVCYMLITMHIDSDHIDVLKQKIGWEYDHMSDDELLDVANTHDAAYQCIERLREREPGDVTKTKKWLKNEIYKPVDKDFKFTENTIHFMWMGWRQYVFTSLPPFEDFTDDQCKISSRHSG